MPSWHTFSVITFIFECSQFTASWGCNTSIVDAVSETRDLNHVCYVAINKVFGNFVFFNTQFDYSSLSVYPQFNFVHWVTPWCFGDGAGGFLHPTCPCSSDDDGVVPWGAVCTWSLSWPSSCHTLRYGPVFASPGRFLTSTFECSCVTASPWCSLGLS